MVTNVFWLESMINTGRSVYNSRSRQRPLTGFDQAWSESSACTSAGSRRLRHGELGSRRQRRKPWLLQCKCQRVVAHGLLGITKQETAHMWNTPVREEAHNASEFIAAP